MSEIDQKDIESLTNRVRLAEETTLLDKFLNGYASRDYVLSMFYLKRREKSAKT